ncbi:E3 ubiquitin-protein ligase DZIP3-like [Mytilus galloprovincialis]|uniref:E3 ubiquitin-protein ligase DZIP3-like n=1 Tax=Mytilus galloprovincialis TaxID=29158 RepID=UPI003F7B9222
MAESNVKMNYLRIISLLYEIAPLAVRVKFDKEFHPTNGLEAALRQDRFQVLEPLKRKRIINQTQWNLLFPSTPGTVLSAKFDLTLMICLIRHLTPIQIGDILPLKSDVSEGADLSRLKYYRNMFAHTDAWTLTSKDFETYFSDICQAILRLGGPQFQTICDDLKDRNLNKTHQEILIEMINLQKESSPVPKALQSE